MTPSKTLGFIVSIVLCILVATGCRKTRSARPHTGPDLDAISYARLLDLASTEGGSRSFDAILKLRERGEERAVPVLKTVLEENIGTGNIRAYAAAQALFCIGTPRAHEILQRHLLTPGYSAPQGIRYAFYWDMRRENRHPFMSRYHLASTSKELDIKLTGRPRQGDGQQFKFRIVLTNRTNRSIRIYDPKVYLGRMLVIADSEGQTKRLELTPGWAGRVVSEPVTLNIAPVSSKTGQ